MNFIATTGLPAWPYVKPDCDRVVPAGFIDALVSASRFTGQANKLCPAIQYVYLTDGQLYASDNQCIVEVTLGDPSFGPARFSVRDVAILKAIGGDPKWASFQGPEVTFTWEDGRWCKLTGELVGFDLAEKSRLFLDKFWKRGKKVSDDLRSKLLRAASEKPSGAFQTFKAARTGLTNDHVWQRGAISKVIGIADYFCPDSVPSSFTFPSGRGLIVTSSQFSIKQ